MANERVAVDATHQLIKTERANIGRCVDEPLQELQRCGCSQFRQRNLLGLFPVLTFSRWFEQRKAVSSICAPFRTLRPVTCEQNICTQGSEDSVIAGAPCQHIKAGIVCPGLARLSRIGSSESSPISLSLPSPPVSKSLPIPPQSSSLPPPVQGVIAIGELLLQIDGGLIAVQHIVASAAEQQIAVEAAFQQVGAAASKQPVVGPTALESVFIDRTVRDNPVSGSASSSRSSFH